MACKYIYNNKKYTLEEIIIELGLEQSSPNNVNYILKSIDILGSDRAIQLFEKGKKNNWSLDKILTELQVPKGEKEIILDRFGDRKIYSNIQIFEGLNKDDFKGDKLALALWNKLSGLNLSKIEDLTYDDISELVSLDKPLHSFITGSTMGNKVSVSDFLNQKSIFPKHVIHLGESKIYPNYHEKLKEVKGDLSKTISEIFDEFKSEQNNSKYQSFILEDNKGNLYKIDADFISGFVKLANHIESLVDSGLKQEIKNKVNKTEDNKPNSFISKEEVDKNTINKAINSIKNIEIQEAINRYNIPVKYFSDINDNRAGFFSTGKNIVYINENINNKDLNEVIGHELTHAVTHFSLKFNKKFKDEIENLFNKAKKATNNEYYGLTNLDEFLAEGFNNKDFIAFLQNTKEIKTSKLSLFEKFINSIYKLFKGENKYNEKSIDVSLFNELTNTILRNKNKLFNIEQGNSELNTFDSLRKEIITSLLADNSFAAEINTAKDNKSDFDRALDDGFEIGDNVKNKLKEFLTKAGFQLTGLNAYTASLEARGKEFNVEGVNALIDLTNGIIALKRGASDYSFIEEVAHLAVELSPKDSKMNRALELVVDTDLYRNVSEEYRDKYKNDRPELTSDELETLVRKEIVGKKIANHVFNMTRNDMSSRLYRTLQSIWDSFLKMFKRGPVNELNDYIVKVSKELLNSNSNFFTGEIGKGVMYELDLNEYRNSSVLNGYKENLEDAIRTRIKKLKIFQTKGKKSVTEAEKKTIKDLTESLQKDKITYGLVEFVNIAGSEAASTIKRLKELQENYDKKTPKEIASTLNNMNNYIAAYGPILENIKSDLDLDRGNEETKEILHELKTILNDIDTLQDQYYKIGIPLFANVLFPFISRNPNFDSVEKVIEILKEAPEDISIFRKFLDSMAESHDDILASVDQLVKLHKERARLRSENEIRDLVKLNMQLKAIGVNNTEWMAELDDDGVPTGFFVSNREMGRFKKNVAKFMKDLNSDFGYPNDPEERRNQLMNDSKKNRKAYKKAVQDFFEEHTELNPDFDDIIKDKLTNIYNDVFDEHEKSKEIFDYILNNVAPDLFPAVPKIKETRKISRVADLFQEWLDENRTWSDYTEEFYYGKALTQPSKELYSSKQYADIFKDPLKSEYYDKVMDLKKDKDNHLPGFFTSNLLMPQIRKDFVERLLSDPKSTLKSVGDSFKSREDDHEFGMGYSLTDERNRPVELLPVYFTRAIKDRKDLSLDVTATMAAYIDMANNYKEMNEIVDIIELGDEVLSQRDIAVGTDLLSKTEELFSNKKTIAEQKGGNSYERYKGYTSMSVYGKMKENETWLAPLGLNTSKVVDTFNMYTAIQGLGLNIYSAIANPILGNIMVRQERVAKQFIKEGSLTFADKTYFSELPRLLGDMHSLETDSKLRLFGEYVNVLQDYKSRLFELNTDRNHWGRMFNTSSLFFLNHAGEHQIQYRMALAMAHGYEVELNGETINLWDALDVKDNKLIIKNGAKNKDGSPLTLEDLSSFGLRLQSVNQRLHGIYNDIDRSVIQKWSLGRMAMLFRKFIKPGFNRRFDKKHFNYQSDTLDEGMYRTTARFMKTLYSELKAGQLSIAANWEKLTDEEKANIRRTIVEANYMLAATILAGILSSIAGDDDDNWKLNLAAYQANRIYSELRFYTSPGEALRILKSPAAGINQLQTLTGYFNILDPYGAIFDEDPFLKTYKGGKNKGQTYLWVTTKKSFIPTLKNVENWFTPEEQLKLYMQ